MSESQERDSGWSLSSIIINLAIHVNRYKPLRESSCIPLPKAMQGKHAVVNIKTEDGDSFAWAVLSASHPVDRLDNLDRTSSYPDYQEELNFEGIRDQRCTKIRKIQRYINKRVLFGASRGSSSLSYRGRTETARESIIFKKSMKAATTAGHKMYRGSCPPNATHTKEKNTYATAVCIISRQKKN